MSAIHHSNGTPIVPAVCELSYPPEVCELLRQWDIIRAGLSEPDTELTTEEFAAVYSVYRQLATRGHMFDPMLVALIGQLARQARETDDNHDMDRGASDDEPDFGKRKPRAARPAASPPNLAKLPHTTNPKNRNGSNGAPAAPAKAIRKPASEPVPLPSAFIPAPTSDPNAFALKVDSDAMAPDYPRGCIVVFSPAEPVKDGDDCVVKLTTGRQTFRRVRFSPKQIRLDARSPKYECEFIDRAKVAAMVKAVWIGGNVNDGKDR